MQYPNCPNCQSVTRIVKKRPKLSDVGIIEFQALEPERYCLVCEECGWERAEKLNG